MINKIYFLKNLDKLIGGIASTLVTKLIPSHKFNNKSINRILVIRPGGIGDAALLYPSLKILKNRFKKIQIDILAEKRNAGIFESCNYIDNIYLYDDIKNLGLYNVLKNNYDAVIDTEQWHRLSAVVGYLTRARVRVGFAANERECLFTNPVEYNQEEYEAISFLNLITEITGKKHKFNINEAFLDFDKVIEINDYLKFRNKYTTVIGMFCGATVNERKWGTKNYSLVASKLLDNNVGLVLMGGKNDLKDSIYFERLLGNRDYLNLIGKTTLDETKNIISDLDLFISADSGLMHIAYGVGTKTLSLFGAGIQNKWAPQGTKNIIINRNLSCSPCTKFGYTPKCPYNVKCLSDITAEEVIDKVMDMLPD
ncbi:MAG: glycosyltransferase family 9 protein [Thermodesulfobacteriota bacterium]